VLSEAKFTADLPDFGASLLAGYLVALSPIDYPAWRITGPNSASSSAR
jgi:hypothetical protein